MNNQDENNQNDPQPTQETTPQDEVESTSVEANQTFKSEGASAAEPAPLEELMPDWLADPDKEETAVPQPPPKEEPPPEEAPPESDYLHPLQSGKRGFPFQKMVAHFAGCGRCSYLFAECRVIHGDKLLEKAVRGENSPMITLPWVEAMRPLLIKSYGVHIDMELMQYNGSCPECSRPFFFKSEAPEEEALFKIHVQTRV